MVRQITIGEYHVDNHVGEMEEEFGHIEVLFRLPDKYFISKTN